MLPPQRLPREHHETVENQEERRRRRRAEQPPDRNLEDEAQDADRNRGDDEPPTDAFVAIVAQATANDARDERAHDRIPLRAIEDDQRQRRAEVQHDDKRQKRRAGAIHVVPAEHGRHQNRVAEARNRKQLAHALEQRQNERLEERHAARAASTTRRTLR